MGNYPNIGRVETKAAIALWRRRIEAEPTGRQGKGFAVATLNMWEGHLDWLDQIERQKRDPNWKGAQT